MMRKFFIIIKKIGNKKNPGLFSFTMSIVLIIILLLGKGKCFSKENFVPIKVMKYHNEAYNHWYELKLVHGTTGAVLIHIDSHDDLATESVSSEPKTLSELKTKTYWEGSFIHPAVMHGLVKEIWCVFPEDYKFGIFEPRKMKIYAIEYKADEDYTLFYFTENKPPVTAELKDKVTIVEAVVHYGHINDLPDFSKEKRSIFLDFDCDYFGTQDLTEKGVPFHTIQKMIDMKVPDMEIRKTIEKNIIKTVSILKLRNVKPDVITIAESPDYTVEKYRDFIKDTLYRELTQTFLKK